MISEKRLLEETRLVAQDWEGWQVQGRRMDIGYILFVGSEIFCFVFDVGILGYLDSLWGPFYLDFFIEDIPAYGRIIGGLATLK